MSGDKMRSAAADAPPLVRPYRRFRRMSVGPIFDLDKYQKPAAPHNQVNLAIAGLRRLVIAHHQTIGFGPQHPQRPKFGAATGFLRRALLMAVRLFHYFGFLVFLAVSLFGLALIRYVGVQLQGLGINAFARLAGHLGHGLNRIAAAHMLHRIAQHGVNIGGVGLRCLTSFN